MIFKKWFDCCKSKTIFPPIQHAILNNMHTKTVKRQIVLFFF